jgi:hypothetical protein
VLKPTFKLLNTQLKFYRPLFNTRWPSFFIFLYYFSIFLYSHKIVWCACQLLFQFKLYETCSNFYVFSNFWPSIELYPKLRICTHYSSFYILMHQTPIFLSFKIYLLNLFLKFSVWDDNIRQSVEKVCDWVACSTKLSNWVKKSLK